MTRTLLDEAPHGAASLYRGDGPALIFGQSTNREKEKGDDEMTGTTMRTPWGCSQDIVELAEGVWRVSTAGHGGLKLSPERWAELPAAVRDTMMYRAFAEEDCEESIVRTLLGLGDDREREMAVRVAEHFERYAPALPYLREKGGSR